MPTTPGGSVSASVIVESQIVRLLVRGSRSLKDKRQVVRSILDRLRHDFNVSITEVDAQDHPQLIVLGMAVVGDDGRKVRTTLENIAHRLRGHPIAEFLDCTMET